MRLDRHDDFALRQSDQALDTADVTSEKFPAFGRFNSLPGDGFNLPSTSRPPGGYALLIVSHRGQKLIGLFQAHIPGARPPEFSFARARIHLCKLVLAPLDAPRCTRLGLSRKKSWRRSPRLMTW